MPTMNKGGTTMDLKEVLAAEIHDDGRSLETEVDNKTYVMTDLCYYGSD